jgi:DNA processing protein
MLKELFFSKQGSTSHSDETIDILRLIRSENVGPRTFASLINLFGCPKVAIANIAEFSIRGGRSKPIKVASEDEVKKEIALLVQNGSSLVTYKSPEYSQLLLEIPDFPPVLSYKGNIKLLNHNKSIAMVGARNASANGRTFAAKIAKELIEQDYVVVSGLARGIDTAVHQVNPARTIAVLAGGIDYIYPPENSNLYNQISEQGLIIAELPIGSKPLGQHFPQRNRLISGLSLGTVVIEASLKSGSLITAKSTLEQNREIFAVPGFPLDPRCQGTNQLIKEGAYLVESVHDIITNLPHYEKLIGFVDDSASNKNIFVPLNPKDYQILITDSMRQQILDLLSATPINIDVLIKEANLPLPILYTIILELELAGKVLRYPGNKLSLINFDSY